MSLSNGEIKMETEIHILHLPLSPVHFVFPYVSFISTKRRFFSIVQEVQNLSNKVS